MQLCLNGGSIMAGYVVLATELRASQILQVAIVPKLLSCPFQHTYLLESFFILFCLGVWVLLGLELFPETFAW